MNVINGVLSDEIAKQALFDMSLEKTETVFQINEMKSYDEDVTPILEFGFNQLSSIRQLWESIESVDLK